MKLGCTFTKTPNAGGMKGLAFVNDPDGYLIEVLPQGEMITRSHEITRGHTFSHLLIEVLPQGEMITKPIDCDGIAVDGGSGYKDNSK